MKAPRISSGQAKQIHSLILDQLLEAVQEWPFQETVTDAVVEAHEFTDILEVDEISDDDQEWVAVKVEDICDCLCDMIHQHLSKETLSPDK